ncbi:MAG: hypothetical protein GKR94_11030 [Gammaproteobacteria bacterium]|nr:hypothetical protein [Gammaproteobacteria bacterium]
MSETAAVFPAMAGQRRLADFMRSLRRARYRQLMVEHASAGLFVGLSVAAVVLLIARLTQIAHGAPAVGAPAVLAGCVLVALGVALAALAWRRPEPIALAIAADVRLRLKQKLSTAIEVLHYQPEHPLAEQLVVQALDARLPPRVQHVFPLSLPIWGKLLPLAAAAVVFAMAIEVTAVAVPRPVFIDRAVADEGVRLRAFAALMERRAERDELPLSAVRARDIHQLGAQMAAGALARREALSRLAHLTEKVREAQRTALRDGPSTPTRPLDVRYQDYEDNGPGAANIRALLAQLAAGGAGVDALRALRASSAALGQSGLTEEAVNNALQALAAGRPQGVQELLRQLRQHQQVAGETSNLREAEARLRRSRQVLGGEQTAQTVPGVGQSGGRKQAAGEAAAGGMLGEEDMAQGDAGSFAPGRGNAEADRTAAAATDLTNPGGEVIKPEGRYGEGQVFQSWVRALPRLDKPTLAPAAVSGPLRAQLEAVLSKEQVPAHRKEVIRKYFLALTQPNTEQDAVRSGEEHNPQ